MRRPQIGSVVQYWRHHNLPPRAAIVVGLCENGLVDLALIPDGVQRSSDPITTTMGIRRRSFPTQRCCWDWVPDEEDMVPDTMEGFGHND